MARPSKYEPKFARQAKDMAAAGLNEREIAQVLGIAERTMLNWKAAFPAFLRSLKVGKKAADERVIQSLFRRATGYEFDAVKIMQHEGKVVRAKYVEHVPPHPTAAIFWLCNREKANWRQRVEVEHDATPELAEAMKAARARAAAR